MLPSTVPLASEAPAARVFESEPETIPRDRLHSEFVRDVFSGAPLHFPEGGFSDGELRQILRKVEAEIIQKTIRHCGGNKFRASRMLGLSYRTIYNYVD